MNMKKQVSIKEIAVLAGVSIATVSRVINQKGGYSAETEQRIKDLIKKEEYTPNLVAKGLRTNQNPIIGILVPDIANEHFSRLILELQNLFFARDYLTMVCNANESRELEKRYLTALAGQNVSGLVIVSGAEKNLMPKGIPTVYVGRQPRVKVDEDTLFVESDNIEGGYLATKELIDNGCKRIAFISDILKGSSKVARYQGYCNALMEAGIELKPAMIIKVDRVTDEMAYTALLDRLRSGMAVDGIMCTTDMLAIGAINALIAEGIRVPEDVKVTGFDDIAPARYFKVPITTIHQYTDQIAKKVTELLLNLIDKETVQTKIYTVPVKLIKRESTK